MSLSLLPWLSYVRELHVSLSLLISLQVNSHSHEHNGKEGGWEWTSDGGGWLWKSDRTPAVEGKRTVGVCVSVCVRMCVCVCKPASMLQHVSATETAQRSRAANDDSSGMSPELSAEMEIKRAVSGPTASQSDSHVNNIGRICCNLGIIYPPPLPGRTGGKMTICPLKVEMSISGLQEEKACVSYSKGTVARAWAGPCALPAPLLGPGSENHYGNHLSVVTLAYIHFTFMAFKPKTDAKGL